LRKQFPRAVVKIPGMVKDVVFVAVDEGEKKDVERGGVKEVFQLKHHLKIHLLKKPQLKMNKYISAQAVNAFIPVAKTG
jgi:hypothetical protein